MMPHSHSILDHLFQQKFRDRNKKSVRVGRECYGDFEKGRLWQNFLQNDKICSLSQNERIADPETFDRT
jgi:hypothetical protein